MIKKDLISMTDLSREEIIKIYRGAAALKKKAPGSYLPLKGKAMAMIFQKPSTRTRVSFEVGMMQLGGHSLFLSAREMQLGRGETIADTAKTLSRYVDLMLIRADKHSDILELAKYSTVPVINGLSELEHPCQVLSDVYTILEKFNLLKVMDLSKIKLSYVGDGNNITNSLLLLCATLGMKISICTPEGYEPDPVILKKSRKLAEGTGASIELFRDTGECVKGAHIVYTDVWTSMGQESETEERKRVFRPFQVNSGLLKKADKGVMVMHCLPAHRGEEITREVMDGPRSIVFDQAENRLHVQKALLVHIAGR
jgi:ornithine carbamoyltransferase